MRGPLILFLFLFSAVAWARPQISMGLGLESRIDREINPGFTEFRPVGQLFQQIRLHPWTASLELTYDKRDTSSGGLRVQSVSGSVSTWGRFNFAEQARWSPFVSAGLGAMFGRVTSSYASESESRRGTRWLGGIGLGISKVYFTHLLVEAEGRASAVQDRKEALFAFVVRAGVQL